MNPWQRYQKELDEGLISEDEEQRRVVARLQMLFEELTSGTDAKPDFRSVISNCFATGGRRNFDVKGIYLWGGVGRGKTYRIDLFYDCLPFERKLRIHFHRFMQRVHNDLARLQGCKNPLEIIADQIVAEALLLQGFYALAPDKSEIHEREQIEILNRRLQTIYCAGDVVWFEFAQLCDGPRSAFDYVEMQSHDYLCSEHRG